MKNKKFTLIELLAVMLIFGILASIGLSISKPSQVKNEVSQVIGLLQRARAHALENRVVTYVRFDTAGRVAQIFYKDQFTDEWQKQVHGSRKDFSQGVEIKMYHEPKSKWTDLSSSQDSFGVMFDTTGRIYVDKSEFDGDNEATSNASGLDLLGNSFAIYDESNTKNIFVVNVNLVGSYEVFEGRDEIPSTFQRTNLY